MIYIPHKNNSYLVAVCITNIVQSEDEFDLHNFEKSGISISHQYVFAWKLLAIFIQHHQQNGTFVRPSNYSGQLKYGNTIKNTNKTTSSSQI